MNDTWEDDKKNWMLQSFLVNEAGCYAVDDGILFGSILRGIDMQRHGKTVQIQ